jgi:Druantia protein DruA
VSDELRVQGRVVRAADRTPLACLLFGAAAWKAAARDAWIGWSAEQRAQRLQWITNNTRFLILPGVHIPYLASHVLGRVARRIARDWQAKYGHPVVALETFVQRDRFSGACYRAANWIHLGATTGRSRQDRDHRLEVGIKDLYFLPLCRRWRDQLPGLS